MNLPWLFYGLTVLLVLCKDVEGRHGNTKKGNKLQRKRDRLKGNNNNNKKLDLGSKDDSSAVTKRQFLYRPDGITNYPILKPPPIRHFVVHHHAG